MTTFVTAGGNDGAPAYASGLNGDVYTFLAGDTALVGLMWADSACVPTVAWQGANAANVPTYGPVTKHPSTGLWFCVARFTGMVASTNEQVIVTLDIPGGGRSNWAIEVVTLRALPGSYYNVVYGFATAPASGDTVLTTGGPVALGSGGGIVVSMVLTDNSGGGFTQAGGYTVIPGQVRTRAGQYQIFGGATSQTPSATRTGVQTNGAIISIVMGASPAAGPTAAITGTTTSGQDVVVTGTCAGTGTTTVAATLTDSTGATRGPVAATVTGGNWTATFLNPGFETYRSSATATDTIGSTTVTGGYASAIPFPIISPPGAGAAPLATSGTGVAGATIDLLIDATTAVPGAATVSGGGTWTAAASGAAGLHQLQARQTSAVGVNDGTPGAPTAVTLAAGAGGSLDATVSGLVTPRTRINIFYYATQTADDSTGVLVASGTTSPVNIPAGLVQNGYYSAGLENWRPNGIWYGTKCPRTAYGIATGADTLILPNDASVISWMTPDFAFPNTPTDGSFQVDSPSNRQLHLLPTYGPGVTGANHSAEGIAWPGGGAGDAGFALRRTLIGGHNRYHHQIGNALPVQIGGTTYRSEILQPGGSVDRGQEFWVASLLRFDASMVAGGAPFCSFMDLHHEQYDQNNPYGGPGPMGIWGSASGAGAKVYIYRGLGVNGAWVDWGKQMFAWTPAADTDYWIIINGKQDHRAGQGAFIKAWVTVGNNPLAATPDVDYAGPWGVDNATNATSTMNWKAGMYAFSTPGNGPFSTKSTGLIVLNGAPAITAGRMLATLRNI